MTERCHSFPVLYLLLLIHLSCFYHLSFYVANGFEFLHKQTMDVLLPLISYIGLLPIRGEALPNLYADPSRPSGEAYILSEHN